MAGSINLAGGYGAGGAAASLEDILRDRLVQAQFLEAKRRAAAQEELAQQERADRVAQSQWMQKNAVAEAAERGNTRVSDLARHTQERTEDRTQHKQERGEDVAYRSGQAQTAAEQAAQRFDMEGQQFGETRRHNMADESISRARVDASGANRTVTVRHTDPTTGQEVVEYLTPAEARARGAMQAPPSAAQKKTLADTQAGLDALKNIQDLYKDEYVGPVAGRLGTAEIATGIGSTKERAQFATAVAALKNQVVHEITGAQMGREEAARILASVPDVTNPPDVFQARMEETRKNRERLRAAAGGKSAPSTPTAASTSGTPAPKTSSSAYDLYLQRLKGSE